MVGSPIARVQNSKSQQKSEPLSRQVRKIDESKDSEDEEDEAVLAALQGSEAQVHVIMVNYFDCFLNGIYDCTELFACVYVCIVY